ncbi:ATP-dependent DNA ligase [Prosthecomicrobium hirschii]|uniref:DNA ligase (ATP) n=1 Tax=Prosthecodimorpha hirschii TaxID=665126 RepID=A0A0P6VJB6_9HYPH|nr:cisplatin damage response ATP-dependent DNA ligase [Prosthecomicrobium hirschii]KPL52474.1 ATP-dependent DNA ligase [Prosthecomicrobium hirschii]
MNRFAQLLDRLAYEPRRNAKIALMADYFRHVPDPERGYALAALTGSLGFAEAKPGLVRALIAERTDPVLFGLSYDFVGDLSETVALMWPAPEIRPNAVPSLAEVVETLAETAKRDLPAILARWLDALDEAGRWACLKLITGGLRVGVSARLAKTAVAQLGAIEPDEVEHVWHGLAVPYLDLFAWVEGRGPRPESDDPAPFRPPMLAHAVEDGDFDRLDPAAFVAEWKWDGIRVQAAAGLSLETRRHRRRLYSRTGEDIGAAFPDLLEALDFDATIDGELLVLVDGRVQSFNVLQQRLNRKTVTARMLTEQPAHIRAYDLLVEAGEDLRALPFAARRERLERFIARTAHPRLDLSPLIPFASWEALAEARADPAAAGAGPDAEAVEGVMLKRHDSPYLPGRPKGLWYKWKRDPRVVDAVLMYAQRGHGKRSSFYSDFTFGVWRGSGADAELVPVGKAYFGFTDQELTELDRFVRRHTINRFGPVREVQHDAAVGLVLEVAFEGLGRSTRHKSGVAMRFPRISRIRWDKPPAEADRIEVLEAMLRSAAPADAAPADED